MEKVRRGEPIRRCLSCNTCINEMRGGARIGCVVNGAAGREILFAAPQMRRDERIAVIGAGPAGLTYASLVAEGNYVTVFEKEAQPGGAFKFAAKAPLFQEVETEPRSFNRYIADLAAACRVKGVQFRLATDAVAASALLAGSIPSLSPPAPNIASGCGRSPTGFLIPASRARQALRGYLHRRQSATGSTTRRATAAQRGSAIWRGRGSASS